MSKPAINPNEVGDLVPMLTSGQNGWQPVLSDHTYDTHLKEIVHKTPAVRKRWTAHRLQLDRDSSVGRSWRSLATLAPCSSRIPRWACSRLRQ